MLKHIQQNVQSGVEIQIYFQLRSTAALRIAAILSFMLGVLEVVEHA